MARRQEMRLQEERVVFKFESCVTACMLGFEPYECSTMS